MSALPEDLWSDAEADIDLEQWQPLDLATAERLMRQYRRLESRIDHLKAQARQMRADIDKWEDDTTGPMIERLAHLDAQLQEMARIYRASDPKHHKTMTLPSGVVKSITTRPALDITDEAELIGFLRNVAAELDRPIEDFCAVRISVKKEAVKGLLAPAGLENGVAVLSDGEPVPGVEVRPAEIRFTVKAGGGE